MKFLNFDESDVEIADDRSILLRFFLHNCSRFTILIRLGGPPQWTTKVSLGSFRDNPSSLRAPSRGRVRSTGAHYASS